MMLRLEWREEACGCLEVCWSASCHYNKYRQKRLILAHSSRFQFVLGGPTLVGLWWACRVSTVGKPGTLELRTPRNYISQAPSSSSSLLCQSMKGASRRLSWEKGSQGISLPLAFWLWMISGIDYISLRTPDRLCPPVSSRETHLLSLAMVSRLWIPYLLPLSLCLWERQQLLVLAYLQNTAPCLAPPTHVSPLKRPRIVCLLDETVMDIEPFGKILAASVISKWLLLHFFLCSLVQQEKDTRPCRLWPGERPLS